MAKKREFQDFEFEVFTMPFGKHVGKTLDNVPAWYLLWLEGENYCPEIVAAYCDLNREDLEDKKQEMILNRELAKYDDYREEADELDIY